MVHRLSLILHSSLSHARIRQPSSIILSLAPYGASSSFKSSGIRKALQSVLSQSFSSCPSQKLRPILSPSARLFSSESSSSSSNLDSIFNDADNLWKEGKTDEALSLLQRTQSSTAFEPKLNLKLAAILMKLGRIEEAKDALNAILTHDPSHAWAYCCRAAILSSEGDLQSAIKDYEFSIRFDPTSPTAYDRLGQIYMSLASERQGPSAYRSYLQKACNSFEGALREGGAAQAGGETAVGLYYQLGLCQYRLGELQTAVDSQSNALAIDSSFAPAFMARAEAHQALEEYRTAIGQYESFLQSFEAYYSQMSGNNSVDPSELLLEALLKQCQCYVAVGDVAFALRTLTTMIEDFSTSKFIASALHLRGSCHALQGQWAKCLTDNTRAIQLNPGFVAAYKARAGAYQNLGKVDDAEEDNRRASLLTAQKQSEYMSTH